MNNLIKQLNIEYSADCLKTMYACSCSDKQDYKCKTCRYDSNCIFDNKKNGFVRLNNLVYDFDMISVRFNKGTEFHSVDSLIIHNNDFASLIEFTDGEPRNKKLVNKCIDTVNTLKEMDETFISNNFDFYFVYNSQKFHEERFNFYLENSFDSIDEDLFTSLMDLNADDIILIRYFKLDRVKSIFKSVFALNEKKFSNEVNSNTDKWNVYHL